MQENCVLSNNNVYFPQTSTIGNVLWSMHGAKSSVIASLSRQAVPQNRVRVPTTREREFFLVCTFRERKVWGLCGK